MSAPEDFGSSLFKLQGEEATPADTMAVLSSIVASHETRSKCGGFSRFVRDLPESRRHVMAQSMAAIYLSLYRPPEDEKLGKNYIAAPALVAHCCPPPFSAWKNHVTAKYEKSGKASSATVRSEEVADVLRAIEQLWGVSGYLLKPL